MMNGYESNKYMIIIMYLLITVSCKNGIEVKNKEESNKLDPTKVINWNTPCGENDKSVLNIFTNLDSNLEFQLVTREEFHNAYKRSITTIPQIKDSRRINEKISDSSVIRKLDTLKFQNGLLVDSDSISYFYGSSIGSFYLIRCFGFEVAYSVLYQKENFRQKSNYFMPFTTVTDDQRKYLFQFNRDYTKDFKTIGTFKIDEVIETNIKTVFEYRCNVENNWIGLKSFWSQGCLYFIYYEIDESGNSKNKCAYVKMKMR